jgi:hypothetical protein
MSASKSSLEPPAGGSIQRFGRALPEQPVVDEHQVRALGSGPLEQLRAGTDARDHELHVFAPGHLQAVRSVVLEIPGIQEFVEIADEVLELSRHARPHF